MTYQFDVQNIYRGVDDKVRDAFYRLNEKLVELPFLGFNGSFFEITFTQAVTDFSYPHSLPFKPIDVITTYKTDGVTVTFKPDSFTQSDIVLTTSAACTIRALIGRFKI